MSCLGWMRRAAAASSSRSSSATAGSLAAAMLARFAFASALASAVPAAAVDTPIDNSAAVKGSAPSRSIAFITRSVLEWKRVRMTRKQGQNRKIGVEHLKCLEGVEKKLHAVDAPERMMILQSARISCTLIWSSSLCNCVV